MITSRIELGSTDVALHYNELDNFYREIWGEHIHHGLWLTGHETPEQAVIQLVDLIARQAGACAGYRVCDVGCGYGAASRILAREWGAEVTALTISEAQYNYACARYPGSGNPRYLVCDWLKNNLRPETFDSVIAIESSEHMPDKPGFFAQAFRVLRPGGRCVVSAWFVRENISLLERHFLLEPVCREGRMPGIGTVQDYRVLFADAGFNVESYQDITRQVKKTWPICAGRFIVNLFRNPAYARYLFNRHSRNRIFAITMFRIWLAFNTGGLLYGVFTARKPLINDGIS